MKTIWYNGKNKPKRKPKRSMEQEKRMQHREKSSGRNPKTRQKNGLQTSEKKNSGTQSENRKRLSLFFIL